MIHVLLIEDDPDDASFIREMLDEAGEAVFSFTHRVRLEEGLCDLKEKAFDVILLDLNLPESRGLETLRTVRRGGGDAPIIVLTGLEDESVALGAASQGAQDYLLKGDFDGRILTRSIRYAIERSHLLVRLEQSQEERFRHLIEKSADAMMVIDHKGMVRFVNPVAIRLFERPESELVGHLTPFLVAPHESREIKIPSRDGNEKIAEIRLTVIEWARAPAYLASIRDITELKRVEQLKAEIVERTRLDNLKDDFISTVSHELRTPLTIIKGAVTNLQDGVLGPLQEKQARLIDVTGRNVDRLAKILNNLLDLSRLESGKAKINRRRLITASLLSEVIQGFQMICRDKKVVLEGQIPANLPPIYADGDMMAQVLDNLINNALRFARSKIVIQARVISPSVEKSELEPASDYANAGEIDSPEEWGGVEIGVIDDGPGIPAEKIGDLFEKFVQIDRPEGGAGYKGTGLGLAICKEIIEWHQGKIGIKPASESAGSGLHVFFTVPQYNEELDLLSHLRREIIGAEALQSPLSVVVLGIQNLQEIKKRCPPETLALYLQKIADRVQKEALRQGDSIFSYTDRCLIVIAPTGLEGGRSIAKRSDEILRESTIQERGEKIQVRWRIGISSYPNDATDPKKLFARALAEATEGPK